MYRTCGRTTLTKAASENIAVNRVLVNVAREVDILARKAHQIDEAMGDAICAAAALEALPLELTQDVDLMRQSADCVHIMLSNLAEIAGQGDEMPDEVDTLALTKGVYLSAIRERVIARASSAPSAPVERGEWIDL